MAYDHLRRELTIVESLDDFGFSDNCPAVDEYFLALLKGNSLQDFQKGPFCLSQRKLARENDVEEVRLRLNLRQHAHCITFFGSELDCSIR